MTAPQQQKLRIAGPVVVTANRLGDGAVVYCTANHGWSTELADAAVMTTAADASRWLAAAVADGGNAIDAYVAPVTRDGSGRIAPGNLREFIRRRGPTIALPAAPGA
jgi:Protein of unknown function (DUF2849)